MSERYSRLYTLPENLYLEGSPVLIAAGALLKDSKTDKVLAQLKLCNLYHSPLTACKVHIRAFEPGGAELEGVDAHSYLDIRVAKGKDFGSQEAVYLPDNTTRRISVCVVQAVFEDGTVWQHSAAEWSQPGFKMQRISALFEDIELQNQYSKEVGGRCTYVPEVLGSLSLCTCGALNLTNEDNCHVCGRKMKDLLSALDVEELTRKRDARIAKEKAERIERERIAEAERKERERREEEQRIERERVAEEQRVAAEKRKKKNIKIAVLTSAIAAVAIAVVLVVTQVIVPANKYKAAEELLAARDYDGAISTFNELGNYKDSSERAAHVPYVRAEDFLADGEYDSALKAFQSLENYGDAAERVKETKLLYADVLIEEKEYSKAKKYLEELGTYNNANVRLDELNEMIYQTGSDLLSQQDYDASYSLLVLIPDYKNSAEELSEIYDIVTSDAFDDYNAGNYAESYDEFVLIKEKYPTFVERPNAEGVTISSYIDEYSNYLKVKESVENCEELKLRFCFTSAFEIISSISNEDLKNELLNLPLIQKGLRFDGVWIDHSWTTLTFSKGVVTKKYYRGNAYDLDFYYDCSEISYYVGNDRKIPSMYITEDRFQLYYLENDGQVSSVYDIYRKINY